MDTGDRVGPSPFEDFWTASRVTPLTQRRLAGTLAAYRPDGPAPDPFELPGRYHALRRPRDRLARLLRRRRSVRTFGAGPLPWPALGSALSALAADGGGRGHPAAGGCHAVRCYPLLLAVRHPLSGRVCRHEPDRHALQDVGPCPPWPELGPLLGASPGAGAPQFVLVFVLADAALLAKYGERGGRFGLIEAGAAAQSVALRLAADGLGGYLLGGAADRPVLALLGLAGTGARLAVALAGGTAP
ncbi:nitroreductase family protein [Prauserella shujinwangii]|uniref:Nitroreductase family protein n=1 Tax=Prauserella shujinwangii TaxID=1453103 RepID=A0A2T0M321_9PSEU|nr:nitroreductase family protein [Prauserella shujinwangii]PRX51109.1 nitroreductase family protein [Prauserella shujinwangii]